MNTNTNLDNSTHSLNAPLRDTQGQERVSTQGDLIYRNAPPGRKSNYRHKIAWQDMPDRKIRAKQQDLELEDNSICTSKYTPITFLPKNLLEQFSKLPNIYFFLMGFLQMVPSISTSGGEPILWGPLAIILMVTACKDLFEDLKRKNDDNKENTSKTLRLNRGANTFTQTNWANLRVGDIIQVREGEFIPADILILKTSESNGSCYIETKNLDGETNLKFKNVDKKLLEYYANDKNNTFNNLVDCDYERPNPNLYQFNGSLDLLAQPGTKIPLTNQNFLLRACSLRTTWVIGLVCYTGHDTKIMLNSVSARGKSSKLERLMNKLIVIIFILQNVWCALCSFYSLIWFEANDADLNYLLTPMGSYFIFFWTRFGNWLIIFTNFVPISLLVSLEMVKFVQGIFVTKDPKMCASFENSNTTVQTSRLMEELGQVEYIFSDKTGTLTCNIMEFKNVCVFADAYGDNKEYEGGYSRRPVTNVDFKDERFFNDIKNPDHPAHEILTLLSTCHTINIDQKDGKYSASSPDELALVNFAKFCGYEYSGTSISNELLVDIKNEAGTKVEQRKFKLLHVLEFDSDRKRMSVIVETPDGRLVLFCKGADSIIWERSTNVSYKQKIIDNLEIYSNKGLRTLLLSKKEIPRAVFESWNEKYMEASCAIQNRDQQMAKLQDELEREMIVIGATAIEDKLQDAVGESIAAFKEAGIKVWVLTGDKVETAMNIGFSCRLLDKSQKILTINVQNVSELNVALDRTQADIRKLVNEPYAIVITGPSLIFCDTEDLKGKLYNVCRGASVVLACRVSPKQKKDIVELVKNRVTTAVTLAIGDGANDVNMITAAHIGVGIRGLEGYQAARASDFAIGEFKLLKRLLFYYGRESYRKNSALVLYNFYKNMIYILPQFWNGFYNGLSGNNLYESLLFQCFNIIFAAFPIILFSTLDEDSIGDVAEYSNRRDSSDLEEAQQRYDCSEYLCRHPKIYTPGQRDNYFNQKTFWFWFGNGVVQAFFMQLASESFLVLENTGADSAGRIVGFNTSGMEVFQLLVLIANFKILLFTNTYSVLVITCLILSNILYPIFYAVLSDMSWYDYYMEFPLNYNNWNIYLSLILGLGMTTLIDLGITRYMMGDTLDENEAKLKRASSNSQPIRTAIEL